jgi:glycosyltransferase involved in cell wall biosynthesis
MKKTLFILPSLAGGGAERVCINLITFLRQRGIEVDLVVISKSGELINQTVKDTLFLEGSAVARLLRLRQLILQYDEVVAALEIKTYIWVSIGLFCKKNQVNISYWLHKDLIGFFSYQNKLKVFFYKSVLRLVLPSAKRVICVSKGAEESFKSLFPGHAINVHSCYNLMNFRNITQLSNKGLNNIEKDYLVAVGRLEQQKGFDFLLEAYYLAFKKGFRTPLYILGRGSKEGELKDFICKKGMDDYIKLLGFQEPYPYIKNAACLILPSRMEALPTVLIESAYLQTPFIAFNCRSGPREIFEQLNGGGVIINNFNVKELSISLMNFKQLYSKPVDISLVKTVFGEDEVCDCWFRVLDL